MQNAKCGASDFAYNVAYIMILRIMLQFCAVLFFSLRIKHKKVSTMHAPRELCCAIWEGELISTP